MSLAQMMHFLLDMFQMTATALMTNLNSLSKVINHRDTLIFFGIAQIFWLMATLSSAMDCPSRTPSDKNLQVSNRVNVETTQVQTSADQPIRECWVSVELPHLVRTIAHLKSHHNVFQNMFSSSMVCSFVIVTASLSGFSNQNDGFGIK